eukprot:30000-Pelagococcus_subviridis.AAC.1
MSAFSPIGLNPVSANSRVCVTVRGNSSGHSSGSHFGGRLEMGRRYSVTCGISVTSVHPSYAPAQSCFNISTLRPGGNMSSSSSTQYGGLPAAPSGGPLAAIVRVVEGPCDDRRREGDRDRARGDDATPRRSATAEELAARRPATTPSARARGRHEEAASAADRTDVGAVLVDRRASMRGVL